MEGGGRIHGAAETRAHKLHEAAQVAIPLLDSLPALAASRDALLRAIPAGAPTTTIAEAVGAAPNLALAVLRLGARGHTDEIATVAGAVEALPEGTLLALAESTPTFDPLHSHGEWTGLPARFRLHALTVRRIAERLAVTIGRSGVDSCITLALVHDIGKLALHSLEGGYPSHFEDAGVSPEERIAAERSELGTDHAAVGALLARRWELAEELATGIECHHEATDGPAAVVRIADMLAHYAAERTIDLDALIGTAESVGIDRDLLSSIMYELPHPLDGHATREECPLSDRELGILRLVASGLVAKQVATELGLATSTVRNHLNRIYRRLDVVDKAQAVLLATERGWL